MQNVVIAVKNATKALKENNMVELAAVADELTQLAPECPALGAPLYQIAREFARTVAHLGKAIGPAYAAYRHGYPIVSYRKNAAEIILRAAAAEDINRLKALEALEHIGRSIDFGRRASNLIVQLAPMTIKGHPDETARALQFCLNSRYASLTTKNDARTLLQVSGFPLENPNPPYAQRPKPSCTAIEKNLQQAIQDFMRLIAPACN